MDIGRLDNTNPENTRYTTQKQDNDQVTKAAQQEGEAEGARTNAVSAPPPSGKGEGAQQAAAQQAQQTAQVVTMTTTTSSDDEDTYQAIVNKANNGQSLTASELNVLRSRNPALYAKVTQSGGTTLDEVRSQMEADPNRASQTAREALDALSAQKDEISAMMREAVREEANSYASKYDQVLFGPTE